jgi:hypothetical protein
MASSDTHRFGGTMLYPHLQPECGYIRRFLIPACSVGPDTYEGLTLMGYGTIRAGKRWAYYR